MLKAIFNVCNNFDRVTSTHLVSRIIRTLLPPATDFCFEHSSGLLTTTMVKLSTVEAAAILKEIPLLFDTSHDVECSEAKLKTLKLLANWSLHAVGGVLTGKNDEPMPVKLLLDSDQLKDVATAVFSTCVENFCFKMTKNHSFHLNRASLKVLGDIMAKFIKSCAKNEDSAVRPWKFTQKEQTICKKAMDTFKRLQKEGDVEDKTVGFQVLLIGACLACLFHQTVDAEFIQVQSAKL